MEHTPHKADMNKSSTPTQIPWLVACLYPDLARELDRLRRQCQTQAALLSHSRDETPIEQQYECKLCMDAPIQAVLLPCGHTLACSECASELHECPICRSEIEGITMLHLMG